MAAEKPNFEDKQTDLEIVKPPYILKLEELLGKGQSLAHQGSTMQEGQRLETKDDLNFDQTFTPFRTVSLLNSNSRQSTQTQSSSSTTPKSPENEMSSQKNDEVPMFVYSGSSLKIESISENASECKLLMIFDKYDENILEEWCEFLRESHAITIDWRMNSEVSSREEDVEETSPYIEDVLNGESKVYKEGSPKITIWTAKEKAVVYSDCSKKIAQIILDTHLPRLSSEYGFHCEGFSMPKDKPRMQQGII
jgi:hypothetical protein